MEYVPFGEVFLEERNGIYNTPYKFNAKELDEETGLYYYGARYYNPKTSLWLSVDPLAVYNPVMETEFYGDGQHNGGMYNSGNNNPYIYTYQNPIRYIDPNGKQVDSNAKQKDVVMFCSEDPPGLSTDVLQVVFWGRLFLELNQITICSKLYLILFFDKVWL